VKRYAVRTLGETGPLFTLAPERYRPVAGSHGVSLSALAEEVCGRVSLGAEQEGIVIDTTHVREGTIRLPPPRRGGSPKTPVPPGSLLVSRLRPYLRQIGFVSESLFGERGSHAKKGERTRERPPLLCSTEFSVLVPKGPESLAFLLPFLLSDDVQARLTAAQEGGHRPRVPRETLMSLRVPASAVRARRKTSAAVENALAELYSAQFRWRNALGL
jgi:hypothetical protein